MNQEWSIPVICLNVNVVLSRSVCSQSNLLNYLIKEVSFSLRTRPRIEDKLGNSATHGQVSDMNITASPKVKSDRAALNGREIWPSMINRQEPGLLSKVHYKYCTGNLTI